MARTGMVNLSDAYMDMLSTLPYEEKLDIVAKLIASMKHAVAKKGEAKDVFADFSADWGGNMTTEEYADMLRSQNIESTRSVEA